MNIDGKTLIGLSGYGLTGRNLESSKRRATVILYEFSVHTS